MVPFALQKTNPNRPPRVPIPSFRIGIAEQGHPRNKENSPGKLPHEASSA